ncbi:MAG TPA: carbon-nitrogen hydrolase family protein [Streptosporangiaceae bacterium]
MRVALCQIPVSSQPSVNLDRVRAALAEAAAAHADLAVFPEATQIRFGCDPRPVAAPVDGSFGADLAAAAADAGVALVAGIFTPSQDGRVYNTAVLFDRAGELVAAYRKLHLFDAFGQQESALVAPGDEAVVAKLAGLSVGLQICYDLRFPELTRTLTSRGADLIVMPAAWGAGLFKEEHWITLARARAIENTVWVAAAGQVPDPDEPPTGAPTGIGRSVLIDPMGTVRLDLGPFPGVGVAEVDTGFTAQVRRSIPSLEHRRPDVLG